MVNARPVEKFAEGSRAEDPWVALSRLLRIAAVVDVVQVATN